MSHSEKKKPTFSEVRNLLSPSATIYTEIIQNQRQELDLNPTQFWIDNPLITTYDYIRMFDHNLVPKGVLPSTR